MKFENLKPGMVLEPIKCELYEEESGSNEVIFNSLKNKKVLVLMEPTKQDNFNSVKVLCENKIGYISWGHDADAPLISTTSFEETYKTVRDNSKAIGIYNGETYSIVNHSELESLFSGLGIISGSFNPVHESHWAFYETDLVSNMFFEISLSRWGKEFLQEDELRNRLEQFKGKASVLITNAPRFITKAGLFHSSDVVFLMGADTMQRMVDDYGEIGIAGISGKFFVRDRIVKGVRITKELVFPSGIPHNVRWESDVPENLLSINSTNIRNAKLNL